MRESGGVDPQVLVPPFNLAGKELGAVAAINRQTARALGGNARAAGQQWGRSIVWAPRVVLPLVVAVWRLPPHDLVGLLFSQVASMAGFGARASLGAMEAVVRGRARRQERSAELLQLRLIWDVLTNRSAAWCTCVEARTCDMVTTGVVRGAVEVEGMVCSRRLVSVRPCKGTECARVVVDCMDSR